MGARRGPYHTKKAVRWAAVDLVWRDLKAAISRERYCNGRLCAFLLFCAEQRLQPAEIDDRVLDAFSEYVSRELLWAHPRAYMRDVSAGWNEAVDEVPIWPRRKLRSYIRVFLRHLPWTDFPSGFSAEAERWMEYLGSSDFLRPSVPIRPLRAISVATRGMCIRWMASALVQLGHAPEAITRLSVLVDHGEEILRFFLRRAGGAPSVTTGQIAGTLLMLARYWDVRNPQAISDLEALCRQARPRRNVLSPRSRIRLMQFGKEENLSALLDLPRQIGGEVVVNRPIKRRDALLMEVAVAIELLLTVPLRVKNLATIEIGRHLEVPKHHGSACLLKFASDEVKNSEPIHARLTPACSKLIRLHIRDYRHKLGPGLFLFPSRDPAKAKCKDQLAYNITEEIRRRTGLTLHVHLFRHLAAKIVLDVHPGAYDTAAQLLRNRDLSVTMQSYCGVEARSAAAHFDRVVLGLEG